MFSNLVLVMVLIFVLWLVAMGFYLVSSRQQKSLNDQVAAVQKLLDDSGSDES